MYSSNNSEDYPISRTMWGTVFNQIDTLLRSFVLAYWMTISKEYVLIVPILFIVIMCFLICIRAKKCDIACFIFACISFGGSSFEFPDSPFNTFTFRPLSKGLFAAIFIAFSIFYGTSI